MGDAERVETKLRALIAAANCALCRERVGRCSECGHPIGGLPADAAFAAAQLEAKLDKMAERLRLFETFSADFPGVGDALLGPGTTTDLSSSGGAT